ncbi:antA/AntB antirepressor family protein [Haemophilus influenzae]|uniref:Phage antirepressor Ant n=4 Tax=Haemophilus influenzae TaxID=727 RepID=A0A346K9C7_HAEIF|nr:antA/AntB antirepressor family protein [Haemophilus influenzae]AXP39466.1 hypothetical protein CH628_03875 [Haemophilus influenzae]AXP45656.1 hypothetical protein CH639_03410 [Haemophilus influenzae]AXP64506.1 hypothetical protein CH635_03405 [Haemophilus influenzae]MCK8831688.1 antA/AntB antirepressor family protein [Haemophilus influenzae]MCK8879406.1 antA/AntB antirepressor family protein [Haemophilus influenzae]
MTNLIPISNNHISGNEVKTVNARELHLFLDVSTRFSDWIQRRISEYGFVENQDFVVLLKNEKNPIGGRPSREWFISIDMAKELSMVERNEKGKQARQYFIEMEKVAKNQQKPTALIPQSFSEALMLAAQLQAEKERNAPKVAFVDHYVEVGTSKSFRETAKILKMPERALVNRLVEDKYLYRQSGVLLPYQSAHTKDLFTVKTGTAEHGHNYTQTRVTSKGIEFIASRYASELML